MSNKANWVGSLAGVVAASVAVVTLYLSYFSSGEIPPVLDKPKIPSSVSPINADTKIVACKNKFTLAFDAVKSLTFSIDRDDGYKNIVNNAISSNCYNEAIYAAEMLSLSIDRDANYKSIYKAAISTKHYKYAKIAINKLSLSIDRDEANKQLSESVK